LVRDTSKERNKSQSIARDRVIKGGRGCGLQRDSGRVTRSELARDREVISEMEVNFSGAVAAKMETGDFRALARGESARCGGNEEWRKMEMKTKVEMVTCGDDGFATNKGEVLLHGELWWGEHREI